MNNKVVKSLFWTIAERISSQFIGLVISIILARILCPEDYGVIAAVQIFISFATTFVAGGYGNAIIQKKNADNKDLSSMFLFNTLFSAFMYIIIYLIAPFLVKLLNQSYDLKLLIHVIRVLGIGVVFSSFNSFYRALLSKRLQFKLITCLNSVSLVISAIVGIIMALNQFGVWALVFQSLLNYFVNTILFIIFSKWKPMFYFSWKRFKPMFSYGTKLMLSGLMITGHAEFSGLVICNKFTLDDLAYYKKGINFPKIIVLNIITAINTSLFPIMSAMEDENELKLLVRKFNKLSAYIITPLMFGFASIGEPFINLILTNKWAPCVYFLKISCLNYALQPIAMSSLQYLKAKGKAGIYLLLDVIRKVISITILIVCLLLKKNVLYVVISEVIGNFIAIIVNIYPGKKYIKYSISEQLYDILPKFALSTFMYVIVSNLTFLNLPDLIQMCVQIICGVTIYIICSKLFKFDEYEYVKKFINKSH